MKTFREFISKNKKINESSGSRLDITLNELMETIQGDAEQVDIFEIGEALDQIGNIASRIDAFVTPTKRRVKAAAEMNKVNDKFLDSIGEDLKNLAKDLKVNLD